MKWSIHALHHVGIYLTNFGYTKINYTTASTSSTIIPIHRPIHDTGFAFMNDPYELPLNITIMKRNNISLTLPEDAIFAYYMESSDERLQCINKCDHLKRESLSNKFAPSITARWTKSKSKKSVVDNLNRHGELCCTVFIAYVLLIVLLTWPLRNFVGFNILNHLWIFFHWRLIFEFFWWIMCNMELSLRQYHYEGLYTSNHLTYEYNISQTE